MPNIIHTTQIAGEEYIFRYPTREDAQAMTDYINRLSNEQSYILFQGEQNTLEQETEYLESLLKKISKKESVTIIVFQGEKPVGIADINMLTKAQSHVGLFGISIAKEYRSKKIGQLLMKITFDEAAKNLPQMKMCILGVFSDNPIGTHIYEKFGFTEYGRMPEGIKHQDHFDDEILMYKRM